MTQYNIGSRVVFEIVESEEIVNFDEINDFIKHRLQNIDKIKILYVSRFYPHENHIFLVDLSKVLNENNIKHEILITVDFSKQETLDLQQMITKDISIESIGEISQFELETYYKTSHIFIFPSNSEIFSLFPVEKLSNTLANSPRFIISFTIFEPINPAPPVTKYLSIFFI